MKTTVQVDGLAELEQQLLALGAAAGGKALRKALVKAAGPVRVAAKAAAPVARYSRRVKGESTAPGRLRQAIRTRSRLMPRGAKDVVAQAEVGVKSKSVWYGHFTEYGFAGAGRGVKNKRTTIAPRKYLRNALDRQYTTALGVFKIELRANIDKAAR